MVLAGRLRLVWLGGGSRGKLLVWGKLRGMGVLGQHAFPKPWEGRQGRKRQRFPCGEGTATSAITSRQGQLP